MKPAANTPKKVSNHPPQRVAAGVKALNPVTIQRETPVGYIQFSNPNTLPEGTMLGKTNKPRRNELHTLLGKKRAATSPRYSHRTTAPTEHPSNNPKGSRTTLSDPSLKMEHEKIVR